MTKWTTPPSGTGIRSTPARNTTPSGKCIPQRRRAAENPNRSSQRLRRSARDSVPIPTFPRDRRAPYPTHLRPSASIRGSPPLRQRRYAIKPGVVRIPALPRALGQNPAPNPEARTPATGGRGGPSTISPASDRHRTSQNPEGSQRLAGGGGATRRHHRHRPE